MNFYKKELIDHFNNPRNYGKMKSANLESGEYNPSCGDSIEIQGIVNKNDILTLNFTGKGCIVSQSSASMFLEKCIGKSIDELLAFKEENILNMLGFSSIGPNRAKCALLSFYALKRGLIQYMKENSVR